jgi:anti-anti-sigma factor
MQAFRDGDCHTLVVTGELDLGSAPRFEEAIAWVFAQGPRELMLELSRLEFIDSAGLDAVLSTKDLCARSDCTLCLTPGQKPVQRLFELLRISDHLPFRRQRSAHAVEAF